MHNLYRIYTGLIAGAIFLTFYSLVVTAGIYLLLHNPKAMDFLAFFTGAHLLAYSPGELYNIHTQLLTQHTFSPFAKTLFIAYVNPPFVAMLFIPFLKLGLQNAYAVWTAVNFCVLLVFCYLSYRQAKTLRLYSQIIIILCILTFIPVLTTLLIGQLSILLALIFLSTWILLKKGWEFRSGLVLSLLLIKPQFFILPFLAILLQRKMKLAAGLLTGIVLLSAISFLLVGPVGILHFFQTITASYQGNLQYDPDLMAQHSLQTAFLILLQAKTPASVTLPWIISVVLIGLPTLYIWTKQYAFFSIPFAFQFALLIIATLLTSPHTHFHDLSMLLVVGVSLLSVLHKCKREQKKKLILVLIIGYSLTLIGYIFEILTKSAPDQLWIIADVCYLVAFWFILLKINFENARYPATVV